MNTAPVDRSSSRKRRNAMRPLSPANVAWAGSGDTDIQASAASPTITHRLDIFDALVRGEKRMPPIFGRKRRFRPSSVLRMESRVSARRMGARDRNCARNSAAGRDSLMESVGKAGDLLERRSGPAADQIKRLVGIPRPRTQLTGGRRPEHRSHPGAGETCCAGVASGDGPAGGERRGGRRGELSVGLRGQSGRPGRGAGAAESGSPADGGEGRNRCAGGGERPSGRGEPRPAGRRAGDPARPSVSARSSVVSARQAPPRRDTRGAGTSAGQGRDRAPSGPSVTG